MGWGEQASIVLPECDSLLPRHTGASCQWPIDGQIMRGVSRTKDERIKGGGPDQRKKSESECSCQWSFDHRQCICHTVHQDVSQKNTLVNATTTLYRACINHIQRFFP